MGWSLHGRDSAPGEGVTFELLSPSGELVRSLHCGDFGDLAFRDLGEVWFLHNLAAADVIGDGPELVWAVINPRSYPCVVGATSFRATSEKPLVTLANSGHVLNLTTADLDGDGRDEIIVLMLNNPLGFQHALVILFGTVENHRRELRKLFSPDINAFLQARMSAPAGCLSFTLLGSDAKIVDPPKLNDGQIELLLDGEVRRFDDWGNPETSPLFGYGGEVRESFWGDVAASCAELRLAPAVDPPFTLDGLRADYPEILAEAPMEVAAILATARALASGGHRDNAIELLVDGVDRFPVERDLQLRLGEQLLIAGNREEGRRRLQGDCVNVAGQRKKPQRSLALAHSRRRGQRRCRRIRQHPPVPRQPRGLSGGCDRAVPRCRMALFPGSDRPDQRLVGIDPGWVHDWIRFLQAWARFEASGDAEAALSEVGKLETFSSPDRRRNSSMPGYSRPTNRWRPLSASKGSFGS